jgi:molybdenum cofactor cytidylyltransferase
MEGLRETVAGPRLFAVVPAAGHSRRMGRHKLLLPLGDRSVVGRVIDAFLAAEVRDIFLLVREDDYALRQELEKSGARIVLTPNATTDMRHSVALLLEAISRECAPQSSDAWLLAPADHPALSAAVVQSLRAAWSDGRGPIIVPTYQGRRGHPTLFWWELASRVGGIPTDRGLDWLLEQYAAEVKELPLDRPEVLFDLDTPADYERLLALRESSPDPDCSRGH